MSSLGENVDDDDSLKRIYFEIIDTVVSEMDLRFESNSSILTAVDAATDFMSNDFDYNALEPLKELDLDMPSREEMSVARDFLLNEKSKSETDGKTIPQMLIPVQSAFPTTYRLFEAIETFGSSTTMNECSFSALSRIDTIRRSSMTDQRPRDLSSLAFEKKRLNSVNKMLQL